MAKPLRSSKPTVQLERAQRPSRIRREPVQTVAQQLSRDAWWESREWEIRLAIAGILFFALAISALVIDIGHVVGW
jgi:hypothetical protein